MNVPRADLLAISGLVKRHGRLEVLRGLSMTLAEGRVGVLIGPSGSGKSTVLRCINGLEAFQEGEIVVGAHRLTPQAGRRERDERLDRIRREVGMVFQQFHLFPHLSVLGNVVEAPKRVLGKSHDEAVQIARRLLDRVGLGDRLDSMPHQLSGGQQQRVAIARALAMSPRMMLFDEPTSALDPKMTAEVLAVIADLARGGQTMLVVTHAMGFARRVAHEVHVMAGGVIVESGSPEQIFDAPAHAQTKELLQQLDGREAGMG